MASQIPLNSVKQGYVQQRLNVKIGDVLQLQLMNHSENNRFKVKVIGYCEGRSLIISAPHNNGNIIMLHEGQEFIVRSLSGTQILGFAAEVLKAYMSPYPHVHLKITSTLECMNVRNAYRIDVNLITSVKSVLSHNEVDTRRDKENSVSAVMINISNTGCMLKSEVQFNKHLNKLRLTIRPSVADKSKLLTLPAEICSHREQRDKNSNKVHHIYGIRFNEMEYHKRLLLYCYVYEQIANEVQQD